MPGQAIERLQKKCRRGEGFGMGQGSNNHWSEATEKKTWLGSRGGE